MTIRTETIERLIELGFSFSWINGIDDEPLFKIEKDAVFVNFKEPCIDGQVSSFICGWTTAIAHNCTQ